MSAAQRRNVAVENADEYFVDKRLAELPHGCRAFGSADTLRKTPVGFAFTNAGHEAFQFGFGQFDQRFRRVKKALIRF